MPCPDRLMPRLQVHIPDMFVPAFVMPFVHSPQVVTLRYLVTLLPKVVVLLIGQDVKRKLHIPSRALRLVR